VLRRARLALALVGLSPAVPVSAQPKEAQLIPIDSKLAVFESSRPYYQAAREQLLGHAAGVSVLVFPSFKKEWAVQVAHDRGRPFVLYVVMDASLWGELQQRVERERVPEVQVLQTLRVSVTRRTASLSHDTARVVEAAWEAMLSAARWPLERRLILDGTSYLFFGAGPEATQRVGLARSPEAGTPAAALAELADALRHHAESAPPADSEADILRKAKSLLAKTRTHASAHAVPNTFERAPASEP
jgi:hypothetical protein